MKEKQHDIGEEILEGLEEIKAWQKGEKKLMVTQFSLPDAKDAAKIHHQLD